MDRFPAVITFPLLVTLSVNHAKVVPNSRAKQTSKDNPLAHRDFLVLFIRLYLLDSFPGSGIKGHKQKLVPFDPRPQMGAGGLIQKE